MKIESIKCPNCSASITELPNEKTMRCRFCGALLAIEDDSPRASLNPSIKEISTEEGLYVGEAVANEPHGYGKMQYRNGDVYEGHWEFGQIHGKGTMTYSFGSKFEGEYYKGNKVSGQEFNSDGNISFKGTYKDNSESEGTWYKTDGTVCKEGLSRGNAKIYFDDGSTYQGETQNAEMHGHGIYNTADGTLLEGEWEDSRLITAERIEFANGNKYVGQNETEKVKDYYSNLKPWLNYNHHLDNINKDHIVIENSPLKLSVNRGYTSTYFITNTDTMKCEFENAYVLITQRRIVQVLSILPILEKIVSENKPILIICDETNGDGLTTLIVNILRGTFRACSVDISNLCDNADEVYSEIAKFTSGHVISEAESPEQIGIASLGIIRKAVIDKNSMVLEK